MRPASIVRELNLRKIPFISNRPWNYWTVLSILRNPKYAGCNVWGQTSRKLHEKCKNIPRSQWFIVPGAFAPIIDMGMHQRAQAILDNRTINKSDAELLHGLRRLLKKKGSLSEKLIDSSRLVPALNTYYRRFGSLKNAYRLIGYKQWDEYFVRRDKAARTTRLRQEFIDKIKTLFSERVTAQRKSRKIRQTLLVDGRTEVSVYFCRSCKLPSGTRCWRFDPVASEAKNVALVCLLKDGNTEIESMYLVREVESTFNYLFGKRSRWIKKATPLNTLVEFHNAISVLAQSTS